MCWSKMIAILDQMW